MRRDQLESDGNMDIRAPIASPFAAVDLGARLEAARPQLTAIAKSMLIERHEVDDLVQTTLAIGLARIHQLRDPMALRAWLVTIEIREAYRLRRQLRRFLRVPDAALPNARAAADMARDADIRQALERLPRRRRACLVLHVMVGFSIAETARALRVSENTVKTLARKALATLREELTDDPT